MLKKLHSGASVDSIFLAFIQIITFLCSMVITKILSVNLTKFEYGTYSAVMIVVNTTCSLILLGLPDSINYFYNINTKDSSLDERKTYVNTIFGISLVVGISVAFLLSLLNKQISSYFDNSSVGELIIIVSILPCFENGVRLYQTLFVTTGKARVIAIKNLVISLVRIAIVAVAIVLLKDLRMVFILTVVSTILQYVILGLVFRKAKFQVNPFKFDVSKVMPIFKYSIPMAVYAITNTLMREVDKLVIGRVASTESLALYTNCAKILPLNIITTSFATVLIPYITESIANHDYEKCKKIFKHYLEIGYLTIWMFSTAIMVSSKEVLPFLYSDAYSEGLPIFIIYMIDGMVQFASMHLIIAASGNSLYIMKSSLFCLISNVILDIGLYYLFSMIGLPLLGPAIATCIVTVLYSVIIMRKSMKIVDARIIEILDVKRVAVYLAELFVIAGIVYFLRLFLLGSNVPRYVCMMICCVMCCFIIVLLNYKSLKTLLKQINSFKLEE